MEETMQDSTRAQVESIIAAESEGGYTEKERLETELAYLTPEDMANPEDYERVKAALEAELRDLTALYERVAELRRADPAAGVAELVERLEREYLDDIEAAEAA
jgi:hypothetical protein